MKFNKIGRLMVLMIVLVWWGCGGSKVEEEGEHLVRIDNEIITLQDFVDEFESVRSKYGAGHPLEREAALKLRAAYLNQMIEERLILNEAKRLKLHVETEEIDAAISEVRKDYADDKSFEKMLIKEYINFESWKEKIKTKLLIDKVIAHSVMSKIEITPVEIEAYYYSNMGEFKRDEEVRARQILLRDEKAALDARERIMTGDKFADVAREVSLSPDKASGGDLGYFGRGVMPPEFDEVVFDIQTGLVSPVVASPYGYHLFLVEDKKEAKDLILADVEDEIEEMLKRKEMERVYMEWIEELKSKAKVEINKEVLKRSIKVK